MSTLALSSSPHYACGTAAGPFGRGAWTVSTALPDAPTPDDALARDDEDPSALFDTDADPDGDVAAGHPLAHAAAHHSPGGTAWPAVADEAQLQSWLARIVRQDEAALADLYRAAVGRVYGLALRIVRDAALAEEVAEDTFWQVWRQAPRFDPQRGAAQAWLLTIARSRALDALRARRRAQADMVSADAMGDAFDQALQDETEASGGGDPGLAATGADPQELLGAQQGRDTLHRCLQRLEPVPRQLVALAFFRGLTHDEIASHTGMPLGTVKSHIRRALLLLRQWLTQNEGGAADTADAAPPPARDLA